MVTRRFLLSLLAAFCLLASCAPSSPRVERTEKFTPQPEKETLFVVPFETVMVPAEVRDTLFDYFVDRLNSRGEDLPYEFVILKNELESIDPSWLEKQHYLTGTVYGYIEDSGCCNTAIEINSRIRLHQPGSDVPTLQISYPREIFFDHDYATVTAERTRLAEEVAAALAERFLAALSGR